MITKLSVANFKSIEKIGPLELKPLTIFTGRNSSGKSNLMESIAIIAQSTRFEKERLNTFESSLMNGEFFKYPYPPCEYVAYRKDLDLWFSFTFQFRPENNLLSRISSIFKENQELLQHLPLQAISSVDYKYSFKPNSRETRQSILINGKKLAEVALIRTSPNSFNSLVEYPEELKGLSPQQTPEAILHPLSFAIATSEDNPKRPLAEALSSVISEIVMALRTELSRTYVISSVRGTVELTTKTGGRPLWVGTHGEHLVEVMAMCFGIREHVAKAERISEWAERFGIGKIKVRLVGWRYTWL